MKQNSEMSRSVIFECCLRLTGRPFTVQTHCCLIQLVRVPVWVQCSATSQWIGSCLVSVCLGVVEERKPTAECNVSVQLWSSDCRIWGETSASQTANECMCLCVCALECPVTWVIVCSPNFLRCAHSPDLDRRVWISAIVGLCIRPHSVDEQRTERIKRFFCFPLNLRLAHVCCV